MFRKQSSYCFVTVFVLAHVISTANAVSVDLTAPEVFDVHFYINTNVAVLQAGVHDVTSAQQHWLHHGIDQGLQACGDFHSAQYLARYPDLTQAFGAHNYSQAVIHYLTSGLKEHRHGYLEGTGYQGRWTVSDHEHRLFVSASQRMGGAIDSLVWNHKEFINAWDHGRELQMAMNFVPNGECYNPTEAGGSYDFQNNSTHTNIQSIHAAGNRLVTKVLPAFWMQPDPQHVHGSGGGCEGHTAVNTAFTYQFPFSKTVKLHCPAGVTQPCLHFQSSFTIAGNIPPYTILQMEGPTGYLTADFTVIHSLDPATGQLVAHVQSHPVVMSTPDGHYAMGVYAPPGQDLDRPLQYLTWTFHMPTITNSTNKWTVVFRKNSSSFAAGSSHVLNYDVYVCVGTVDDVVGCLMTLMNGSSGENLIG